jgi:hypothetical protein
VNPELFDLIAFIDDVKRAVKEFLSSLQGRGFLRYELVKWRKRTHAASDGVLLLNKK